ncbi:MAG: threonine synthase [Thermacetogeniaceae bacterium]
MTWRGVIEAYRSFLPVTDQTPVVTLYEGNTILLPAPRLSRQLKVNIYLKFEGQHPTGSFKDRGMTMAVSKALESGSQAVMCASTGNTSASAAAYAARAGIKCVVLVPDGYVALGKLAQALIYGAEVIAIKGNFDEALKLVRQITQDYPLTLVNSINPYRIEGQKTAAFEVCDQLGFAPDYLALPVGNAGNITAYWKGFQEYGNAGRIQSLPRLLGFQAAGAAPIVEGQVVAEPRTMATAIRIGNPASWQKALQALQESHGQIDKVTDEEIIEAYKMVARYEGLFVEPASAASLAGVIKLAAMGFFASDNRVVCVMTGHGLKDPDTALSACQLQPRVIPGEQQAVLELLQQLNVL